MKRAQAQPSNAPDIISAASGFGTKLQRLISTEGQVGKALEPTAGSKVGAMHRGLNSLNNSTCRVVTRSKSRPDAASSVGPADPAHQHHTSLAAAATPDSHAQPLKPSQQQQACHIPLSAPPYGSSHPLPLSSAKLSAAAAAAPHGSRTRSPVRAAGRLQQAAQLAPAAANDVQHLVDVSSKLGDPRLLRHAGVKQSISSLYQQQHAASHAPAAGAAHGGGSSSSSTSGHTSSSCSPTQVPAAPTAAGAAAATPSSSRRASGEKRVSFAPGPLSPKFHSRYITDDGHPASEGALAVPVRRVPPSYALDLTRGNVLMLEQLLGADCVMSVTRLKRRVGLLPPIRPPRPHATSSQYSADGLGAEEQWDEEEQAAAAAALHQHKHHQRHKEGAVHANGMAAAVKVPGKAHAVVAKQGNNGGSAGHQR